MRLSQHERLELKLRQAKVIGDVITIARIQMKIAERALEQAEAAQRRWPQRIDLKNPGAPSHRRARHTSIFPAPVAVAGLSAVATFPPENRAAKPDGSPDAADRASTDEKERRDA